MQTVKWSLATLLLVSAIAIGQTPSARSNGQSLYLPIYSHVWYGQADSSGKPMKTLVSVAVSIRNTDPNKPIRVTSAQYFDTDGKKLREFVPAVKTIAPMGTLELFIPRSDDSGGSGANFVIIWKADAAVNPPLVEAFHAHLEGGRSLGFLTSARPILIE